MGVESLPLAEVSRRAPGTADRQRVSRDRRPCHCMQPRRQRAKFPYGTERPPCQWGGPQWSRAAVHGARTRARARTRPPPGPGHAPGPGRRSAPVTSKRTTPQYKSDSTKQRRSRSRDGPPQ
ncbi:hypothetical protein TPA0909_65610 [Streptomyces albus]|nr:hypothetical protein TPA0909_65610 [Streptomyces albus]